MKKFVAPVLALIIGAIVLIYGVVLSGKAVMCGKQAMKPGDTCVSVSGSGSWDYNAQKSRNQDQTWLALGGGAAFVLLGAAGIVVQLRRRSRSAATPPSAA